MNKSSPFSSGLFLSFAILSFLLLLWATRLHALTALPLHNDEGLHLTRAIEVWNGHPFWEIGDGKIINHWWIAAFYPQQSPAFIGRIATLFIALLGLSATFALLKRQQGAVIAAGTLWLAAPLLFFYERMAFSDAEAGALGLLALLAARRLAGTGRAGGALWTGGLLALALLFKFTAAPFALGVAWLVLREQRLPLPARLRQLALIIAVCLLAFAPPVLYLALRGRALFDIALAWVGAGGGSARSLLDNLSRVIQLTFGVGDGIGALWLVCLLVGIGAAFTRRNARDFALAALLPLAVILLLGRDVQSRHFAVTLPPLIALAGIGWGVLWRWRGVRLALLIPLIVLFAPFALQSYAAPANLRLPDLLRWQYFEGYASGYGLRAAVTAFPQILTEPQLTIIGSMYPDSCRRANFYAADGRVMQCGDAPMLPAIAAALARDGAVYVLVERGGEIGIDVTTLDAQATLLGSYPRPNEAESNAAVQLWLMEQ
jgi:hypothetical protein